MKVNSILVDGHMVLIGQWSCSLSKLNSYLACLISALSSAATCSNACLEKENNLESKFGANASLQIQS